MTTFDVQPQRQAVPALSRGVLPLFVVVIFTSALLLFALEPMFAKMTLPVLGGSPSVWSVAVVFFQALMFGGYCYAHVLIRWMDPRRGALVHVALLCLAFLFLPVALRAAGAPPTDHDPTLWLIGLFAASVGVPFFALSAHGPLLQAWFARSGHSHARDPYFLYSASNVGSFAALLAYPFVIEPLFGLRAQSQGWAIGFVLLVAMIVICAFSVFWRSGGAAAIGSRIEVETETETEAEAEATAPIAPAAAMIWVALAFVPSALLVSVTVYLSNDVAAAPLLWVVPLGLYLLTFVIAFRARSPQAQTKFENRLSIAQPWLSAIILMIICIGSFAWMTLGLVTHLALFVINALVCHAALYRLRPPARHLTFFYAAMSLGGALGGAFVSLLAPLLFSSLVEYPLLLATALFCRPGAIAEIRAFTASVWAKVASATIALALAAAALGLLAPVDLGYKLLAGAIGALLLLNWRSAGRTAIFGVAATIAILLLQTFTPGRESFRSFFGVHRVEEARDGKFRTLAHGKTMHGAIRIRNDDGTMVTGKPLPTTYYAFDGPLGEAIAVARRTSGHGKLNQASFIGLGTGALACHVHEDEAVTFFEIDPLVVWLARDSGRFRFLSDCGPQARYVLGDARLTLAQQRTKSDIIVVDAFSSDAIPTHLLTLEAFELYVRLLAPRGVIAVHISNNTMDFADIIGRIATELGLYAYVRRDMAVSANESEFRSPSVVAMIVRDPAQVRGLLENGSGLWRIETAAHAPLWTDDHATILTAMLAKLRLEAANLAIFK
ncbi:MULTISPECIES: fused MFS/spermidine synthase [unclassified Beijerinckia]|uniref:spermidine synthase n=1 Tax=unclassified Beijerinckia TaxID=2638183 RepID=UPI000894670A|nr:MULTISPECIES: fused MFS/spermidine synthase [unclassified Beijerinckia]MDH7796668.1 spermidine synthase [Beijerinckia sp. GAS462]SEC54914.1 hypothetical protein SAMN05443249_2952 [Beijerinckia sp. 28-YEA-48]